MLYKAPKADDHGEGAKAVDDALDLAVSEKFVLPEDEEKRKSRSAGQPFHDGMYHRNTGAFICAICGKTHKKGSVLTQCTHCGRNVHFDCCDYTARPYCAQWCYDLENGIVPDAGSGTSAKEETESEDDNGSDYEGDDVEDELEANQSVASSEDDDEEFMKYVNFD